MKYNVITCQKPKFKLSIKVIKRLLKLAFLKVVIILPRFLKPTFLKSCLRFIAETFFPGQAVKVYY